MLVLLWQENFQSTGRAETSTPKEQCSRWWSGQGEHQPAELLWSPPSILHDLKCLKIPHHVFECILAIRVISATTCACGISWLVTRFFYLCLEPTVFRLLNKYFGFSGRAEKKKNLSNLYQIVESQSVPKLLWYTWEGHTENCPIKGQFWFCTIPIPTKCTSQNCSKL